MGSVEKIEMRSRFSKDDIKRNLRFQLVVLTGIVGTVLGTVSAILFIKYPDAKIWQYGIVTGMACIDVWMMSASYYSATGASLKFWFQSRKLKEWFGIEVTTNAEEFTKRGRQHVLLGLLDQAKKANGCRGDEVRATWYFSRLGAMYDVARYFYILPSYTEILALADFSE